MSARLVSRNPRPYASFVAVSTSRVRLSGCVVRIFLALRGVSYLTDSHHKPDTPVLSTPATANDLLFTDSPETASRTATGLQGPIVRFGRLRRAIKKFWIFRVTVV